MGEDLLTQVRSYERWTRDGERLREIMSVCECLCVWGGLSGAGFAGFIGIFRMGEDLLTQVGSYERWTRVCERLREITRDCECLRVLGGLSGAGFAGFLGIFRMAGVPPALVRWYERWTRDCERLREIIRDFERWVGCLEQDLQGFWDFRDGEFLADTGALVRAFTSVARQIMRDCERLRAFTRDSDRSSEGTGRAAGYFSVGLPAKAGQRGYFSEFFIKMSAMSAQRHILSSIWAVPGQFSVLLIGLRSAVRPRG